MNSNHYKILNWFLFMSNIYSCYRTFHFSLTTIQRKENHLIPIIYMVLIGISFLFQCFSIQYLISYDEKSNFIFENKRLLILIIFFQTFDDKGSEAFAVDN